MANKEKIKLTRAEKRQLQALMRSRQQRKKPPHSVQETIPYQRMWPDGICRVTDSYYTKTVQFQDINYQLAQNEDKTAIFDGWCDFLNYFDSSVRFQLSFMNMKPTRLYAKVHQHLAKGTSFNSIRPRIYPDAPKPACPGQQRLDQDQVPDLRRGGGR